MNANVQQALSKKFEASRLVFWNDVKCQLRNDYEKLELDGVEKIELKSNEFGVKHRILRKAPEQKFLLYREGPRFADLENWLLDVELSYAEGEFRTDQVSIWLTELGLNHMHAEVVEAHADFCKSGKRIASLKQLLKPDESAGSIRLKMLAVCAGSEARIDSILEHLLQELSNEKDTKFKLIERSELTAFLWEQLDRHYGYNSAAPGMRDFVIELFKSCFAMGTEGTVKLNSDALVFLKRWKDSRKFESSFETLSTQCADVLGIEATIAKRDFRDLIELDYFRLVDQKGVSYEKLFVDYLKGAKQITITDSYIRLFYQTRNLMELLELIVRHKAADDEITVDLLTTEDEFRGDQQRESFDKIQESCEAAGIKFNWKFDSEGTIHARHIVTDTGWKISLDRGLDIFQPYEMNDAFTLANRLQEQRQCKAFEVTYIKA